MAGADGQALSEVALLITVGCLDIARRTSTFTIGLLNLPGCKEVIEPTRTGTPNLISETRLASPATQSALTAAIREHPLARCFVVSCINN